MIFGSVFPGEATFELLSDRVYVGLWRLPQDGNVIKLTTWLDGLGTAGAGIAKVRGLVFDQNGKLVFTSGEATVEAAEPLHLVELPLVGGSGTPLLAGAYFLGLQPGGNSHVMRAYTERAGAGLVGTANYDNGAPSVLPQAIQCPVPSMWAQTFKPWTTPPKAPEEQLASLGFGSAQGVFGAAGVEHGSKVRTTVGWHHTQMDPNRGSCALVRSGGALSALVGERVLVSYRGRSVAAYVIDEADVIEEITLSKALFLRLGQAAVATVDATVEVLA